MHHRKINLKGAKPTKGKDVETNTKTIMISSYCNITVESLQTRKSSHCNIEMQHWILDVKLSEDRFTNRNDNAVINSSVLKKFIMRIKDNESTYKWISMEEFFAKNFSDLDFLSKILFRNDK